MTGVVCDFEVNYLSHVVTYLRCHHHGGFCLGGVKCPTFTECTFCTLHAFQLANLSLAIAEFTSLLYRFWAWGGGAGLLSSHHSPLTRPRHAYVDRRLATVVLLDGISQLTIHAADGPGTEVADFNVLRRWRLLESCTLLTQDNGFSKAAVFA